MSAGQQGSSSQSQSWTEPPWSGWIETTGDALLILEAARRGLIPRVTRRLVDSERKMITSGSVFVFDEDESGIKRWTDGFFWSPSRILGNFLLYRETDKRGNRNQRTADPDSDSPDSSRLSAEGALSRPKTDTTTMGLDKHRERSLCGSLTNSYKFKSDGLMKKTFSLTIGGVAQHLISYYKIEDVENGRLRTPSSLPELASLEISPEYLDKTHFRNAPKVEVGADGIPRYRGEGEEVESPSPSSASAMIPSPMESNLPLLSDAHVAEGSSSSKRSTPAGNTKRYLPYGVATHRPRKKSKSQADAPAIGAAVSSPLSEGSTGSVVLTPPPQATASYASDTSGPVPLPNTYQQYPYYPPPPPAMSYQQYPSQPGVHQQYPYPGYPPADPSTTSQQSGSSQPPPPPPQSYPYPYYPLPHPHMQPHQSYAYPPPPPAAPWPYGGYPPHQAIVQQPSHPQPHHPLHDPSPGLPSEQ